MLTAAYELLKLLWPLLYSAVSKALDAGECPREAIRVAMDSAEAAAIVAEYQRFGKR